MGASMGAASAAPNAPHCIGCGRALSAHWVRKHWAALNGAPVCNCCRAPNVPIRGDDVRVLKSDPLGSVWRELRREPKSGPVWSDPFLGGDE